VRTNQPFTMSDPRVAPVARRPAGVSIALEGLLALLTVSSVLAVGAVYPWAYVPLWIGSALAGFLAWRARGVQPRAAGQRRSRSVLGTAPLLVPGLLFFAWTLVQLVPLPEAWVDLVAPGRARYALPSAGTTPFTLGVRDTWRGLAFLTSALALHGAASMTFVDAGAHRRLFRGLPFLGLLLAILAAGQVASGTDRVYGLVRPVEGPGILFGPFVNRNHFAGYMLMVAPLALGVVARRLARYWHVVGQRPSLSRAVVALGTPQGTAMLYAALPAAACVTALLATTSRGGILAFGLALVLSALLHRKRSGLLAVVVSLVLVALGLGAFGLERLQDRFVRASQESGLRTVVWRDSLEKMKGLWWTGSGLNTFATVSAGATAWALPRGATPWPEAWNPASLLAPRAGVRVAPGASGWYREAHNDYLQVLVESGLPGLLLALWAAVRVLRAAAPDPWLFAALAGVLLHEVVDFDLQIPAVAALFVILAGAGPSQGNSITAEIAEKRRVRREHRKEHQDQHQDRSHAGTSPRELS